MGNVVYIEKRKSLYSSEDEYQVADDYTESEWFDLFEFKGQTPEELVHACYFLDDAACNIIDAAIHNNTVIETPLGATRGATYEAQLKLFEAQEEADQLDLHTDACNTLSRKLRL